MKTNQIFAVAAILTLVACSPAVTPTQVDTLPPTELETVTTISTQVPETTPSGSPDSSSQVLSGEVEIEIEDFAFNPETLTIVVGTTIKWSNKDTAKHTVTGDDGSWGSPNLSKGDDYSFTFSDVGTYMYHCKFHPSMIGTIIVVSP